MADLDKMSRDWARAVLLKEDIDPDSSIDLHLLLENVFESGTMAANIQSILEVMENIRLTSNRDRNRMALAKENMKKVRRHVKRVEERVTMLQEQVAVLEENNKKTAKGD